MKQELLHESLRERLNVGSIFAGLLAIVGAALAMAIVTRETPVGYPGMIGTVVYVVIMVLAYKGLWRIYLELCPNHTQADARVFNKKVKSLTAFNLLLMLAFDGMLVWLHH